MFLFKKILTPFLLPPGIFILFLVCFGTWYLLKKHKKIGIIHILIGCLMWALSITPISDLMLRGLEPNLEFPKNLQGDVIVLLGGGIYDQVPDLAGVGVPYHSVQAGIITAVRLQKRLNVPIIVSGGKVYEHLNSAEAPIIKRFLVELGVPNDQIILEEKSRDTFENAKYTKRICNRFGYRLPIVITSAYHMKRSILSFRKAGMEVIPFPATFPSWGNNQYHWNDYLPGNFKKAAIAIEEYLGIVFYKVAY